MPSHTQLAPDPLLRNVPPHSMEAERAVLGAIMIDPGAMDFVAQILPNAEEFYAPANAAIYETLIDLWTRDQPVDTVIVNEELDRKGTLESVGGTAALAELSQVVPTSANAEYYARIVRDRAMQRRLIEIAAEIQKDAFETSGHVGELMDRAEKGMFEVTQKRIKNEAVAVGGVVREAYEQLVARQEGKGVTGLPSYYADLDEITSGFLPGEMTIVAARPSMGKCLSADAEILLEDGSIATIEELYRRRAARLLTLRDDWTFGITEPEAYVDDGHKPVFRVTTRLGRVVETTITHPFRRIDGWRPLSELSVGDRVAVPRAIPVFGDRAMRECEVKLLAYLIGDGCLTGANPVFTNTRPRIARDFQEAVEAFLLGVAASDLSPGGLDVCRKNGKNPLTLWLTELGLMGKGAAEKEVPALVFQLPRRSLALFLDRLFSTDGWVSVLERGQVQAGYASVSERLARQVQHLLLRFGVVASLEHRAVKHPGPRRSAWQLDITHRDSLERFLEEIGVFAKEAAVERAKASLAGQRRQANRDLVPVQVWEKVTAAKGSESWAALARRAGIRGSSNIHAGRRASSRRRLSALAEALNDDELGRLAGSQIYWDEIVSIEPLGTKQVYDLTIPGTHNFVANDVCVHNTSFALNIVRNIVHHGASACFFSLEMPRLQVTTNMLCGIAKIDGHRLRGGFLTREEKRNFMNACDILEPAQFYIDDSPTLSTMELRAKGRRLKAQHDIEIILIDYMQLMTGSSRSAKESRQIEVSEISRQVKALARELEIPIVCLAQLSRKVEERKDKRPMMSDLRESGCLTGDTRVPLAGGETVTIEELVRDRAAHADAEVWAVDQSSYRLERARVSNAFSTGVKPVFRLTTQLGRSVRATGNHKFLTPYGWRRLDELHVDDFVAIPRRLPDATPSKSLVLAGIAGSGALARPVVFRRRTRRARLIRWDPIVAIEPAGEEEVFDLTVPGLHNFVANDIVVHNSIEQDADKIILLHRPEYYEPDKEELKNKANIIVAKNRNGPTGDVEMIFIKNQMRFESQTRM